MAAKARVLKLVYRLVLKTGYCGFESHWAYHFYRFFVVAFDRCGGNVTKPERLIIFFVLTKVGH